MLVLDLQVFQFKFKPKDFTQNKPHFVDFGLITLQWFCTIVPFNIDFSGFCELLFTMSTEKMSSEGKNFVFTKENFRNPTLPTGLRVVEVCVRSSDCLL